MEKKLKEYLSKNIVKTMDLYIVTKEWLDNYEKNNIDIINNKKNNNINFEFDSTKLIQKFSEAYSIYTFPPIFILDKDCEIINNFKVEGKFNNKLLLIDMKQYSKMKLYIFFCLSQNGTLVQGYLHIRNNYMTGIIIKSLITNGPYYLIGNSGQIYMNNPNMNHNFNIILYEYELKESNPNLIINNINKDNHHNIITNMNNYKNEDQKNIQSENYEIQKRNLESEKGPFKGIKINSKEISNDKEKYAIKEKIQIQLILI